MVFASERLVVGLVATHVPLARVPETITAARYERTVRHLGEVLAALGGPRDGRRRRARVALAAVNPHAGEGGLLGDEEARVLAPFAARADTDEIEIIGPVPADAVFRDARAGRYDAVVAAYHDQAMIPLKLEGQGATANVTAGLPFVRTSPDHGVAYDLAGTGRADHAGMRRAIEIGVALWRGRGSIPRSRGEGAR